MFTKSFLQKKKIIWYMHTFLTLYHVYTHISLLYYIGFHEKRSLRNYYGGVGVEPDMGAPSTLQHLAKSAFPYPSPKFGQICEPPHISRVWPDLHSPIPLQIRPNMRTHTPLQSLAKSGWHPLKIRNVQYT